MNHAPRVPGEISERFPERILVADTSPPDRDECELQLVSENGDWGALPVIRYVRADGKGAEGAR